MSRIGRQIPHLDAVDISSVEALFSSDRRYRYLLSMQFKNTLLDQDRQRSLAVVMKNPSAADERMADATIRKVETFVYHRFGDVRNLHILNIFALRATDPGDLDRLFLSGGAMEVIGGENDRIIRGVLAECDYVIAAWGNTSGINRTLYEERVYRVNLLLQEMPKHKIFCVSGENATKQPLHGLMWGYHYTIQPYIEAERKI